MLPLSKIVANGRVVIISNIEQYYALLPYMLYPSNDIPPAEFPAFARSDDKKRLALCSMSSTKHCIPFDEIDFSV